jgi:enoyl-CoA hydratase/carnithine racemase
MVAYSGIRTTLEGRILTIVIDRPAVRNAIDTQTMNELTHAFTRADRDDSVRVVVVTGSGDYFCAGGDLTPGDATFDAEAMGRARGAEDHVETGGPLAMSVFRSRKPFVAAINGPAVGIGLTLTLPMDVRLSTPDAKLAFSFVRRGIVPDACATWFLPRLVGLARALEWAGNGRIFLGEEAHAAGLVSRLCSREELLSAAYEVAHEYIDHASPVAVAMTRLMVLHMSGQSHPLDAFAVDSPAIFELGTSEDCKEGVRAFKERRMPNFSGRVSSDMPSVYPWWNRDESLNNGLAAPIEPYATSQDTSQS